MKTILFHQHGGPEVLEYADFPTPKPGPGEVLVRLRAAALNRLDIWVRNGWPGIKLEYPHIPGADGAGEVAALGEGVTGWTVGDRVAINANLGCGECEFCLAGRDNLCTKWKLLGESTRGTYCEYTSVPARQLFKLTDAFDFHSAAAAGLVFHTAWHSLVVRGGLKPGETVLIVGATGGVNTASVVIAKYIGAQVIVVGSGAEKLKVAESLGADVLIDRIKEPEWAKAVYMATQKRGVEVVVDNVGTTYPLSFRAACKGGRILTVGNTGGPKFEIDNRFIFTKHLSIIGSSMGTLQDFADVMSLVVAGKLKVALDEAFPLKEARAAQEKLESGAQLGKITLEI
ncbi:MAG: alcohol dehydrogenase catalytic domain-containing protein [Chloroflexi bacterium]|nr:alcohol dehydrogenase catalytic domain-containing protein [Chloroflexota bacterium]